MLLNRIFENWKKLTHLNRRPAPRRNGRRGWVPTEALEQRLVFSGESLTFAVAHSTLAQTLSLQASPSAVLASCDEAALENGDEAAFAGEDEAALEREDEAALASWDEAVFASADEAALASWDEADLASEDEADLASGDEADLASGDEADLASGDEADLASGDEADLASWVESDLASGDEAALEREDEAALARESIMMRLRSMRPQLASGEEAALASEDEAALAAVLAAVLARWDGVGWDDPTLAAALAAVLERWDHDPSAANAVDDLRTFNGATPMTYETSVLLTRWFLSLSDFRPDRVVHTHGNETVINASSRDLLTFNDRGLVDQAKHRSGITRELIPVRVECLVLSDDEEVDPSREKHYVNAFASAQEKDRLENGDDADRLLSNAESDSISSEAESVLASKRKSELGANADHAEAVDVGSLTDSSVSRVTRPRSF